TPAETGSAIDYSTVTMTVSINVDQTVNQAATSTAVTSSANPSVFGQSITLSATVSAVVPGAGIPTGSVEFLDGSTVLGTASLNGSGGASISIAALAVGGHPITAEYLGDDNFSGSTSSDTTQVVSPANTTTSLASSADPSVYGQSLTFTATVAP